MANIVKIDFQICVYQLVIYTFYRQDSSVYCSVGIHEEYTKNTRRIHEEYTNNKYYSQRLDKGVQI
jgi:hypothetical protein